MLLNHSYIVITNLLVGHLEQFQGGLLQGTDSLADFFWIGFILVGQDFANLDDFFPQFIAL